MKGEAMRGIVAAVGVMSALSGCTRSGPPAETPGGPLPAQAAVADSLIREGETHFARLWQLTFGGENAEAYWSRDGGKLVFQSTRGDRACDQIFVMDLATGDVARVSTGTGRTTCGYFYDGDARILFSSTHLGGEDCPPTPDFSQGYVWPVYETFDIFTVRADGADLRRLTDAPGYDAEATVSPDGQWIVFTSVRDGDLDVYRMRTDGSEVLRLTDAEGYDGGPFFSPDGQWICYRSQHPDTPEASADYRRLLSKAQVRPGRLDLWVMRADGSEKRQVTRLPGASFAPFFTPEGGRLIFSSNWENPTGRDFDLFLVPTSGGDATPVTRDPAFDGFPMFSPDGKRLVFASNRGAKERGETNLFLAEWRE
jgi:Tol biopolymer transport system component